jgi:hypothetical protein
MLLTEIDLSQSEHMRARLASAHLRIAQAADRAAGNMAIIAAAMIKDSAPQFLGALSSGIEGHLTAAVGVVAAAEVTASVPYALVQDQGRRPGKWPPKEPIRRWVELKIKRGQMSEGEVESLTFLVRRKIGRHGTKGTHYIAKGMRAAKPAIEAETQVLGQAIAEAIL